MDTQVRLQIDSREPFANGMSFGESGPYEQIEGRVHFEIDPEEPANQSIVDLEHAPRNSQGLVEYSIDLLILKPVDTARGNRRLVYDVNNRGNLRILQFFNDAVHSNRPNRSEHAGNGFLMRQGYTIVTSGWQGDLLPGDGRFTMDLPVAGKNGEEITGVTRMEFTNDGGTVTWIPLSANNYTRSYETASLDTKNAAFTMREYESDPRQRISPDRWQFAMVDVEYAVIPSAEHCYLPEGFKPGWIYELVYTAKNPTVMGLGFTGVRDLISFLIHDSADADGTPNPLFENGTGMEKAYAWGRSQSGRFLRDMVYRGFNADIKGRRVFDAISPHVSGGGRIVLNYRFAQPGRYPRQHSDHVYPSDQFPFAYSVIDDPITGKRDGILKRPETDPLVMHTQTAAEYWERRGSLVHTDSTGNDLGDQKNTRIYLFSGSQHNADPLGGPDYDSHRYPSNPLNTTPLLRAILVAMDDWATNGTAPPDNRIPVRAQETAVPAEVVKSNFPAIQNVECPSEPSRLHLQDHGPDFNNGIMSNEPPIVDKSKEYAVLVPQIGADGNEIPGIRTPHVETPIATYTGWNFRKGSSENALVGVTGSCLPFARTREERRKSGDSRPSLEELYRTREEYARQVKAAVQKLVDQRLLLPEDAEMYVKTAESEPAFD
jgi:hypothetical protein